jgi:hypothetical protein
MKRPYRVEHLFGPPDPSGGGIGCAVGAYATLERAIEVGIDRLTNFLNRTPHDRIIIKRPRAHPVWLYRDDTGRVCRWQRHPSQKHELWGYTSPGLVI